MKSKKISREDILHQISYDSKNGKLYWLRLSKFKKRFIGKQIGSRDKDGYLVFGFKGFTLKVHRVVWFLENGYWPNIIDHINGKKSDNRISNLRNSNIRLNSHNKISNRKGKLVGASWTKRDRVWVSQIEINGKNIRLGSFKTEKEAHNAYVNKLKQLNIGII